VICCNNFGVSRDITGDPSNGEITLFKVLQAVITTICFILPLSLAKNMSALRYISIVSIVSIFYTLVVMLVELPEYFHTYHIVKGEPIAWFNVDLNFFSGCSITFFSFTCQASILPIYSELVNPNEKRMMKVIGRSLLVDCVFYCAIALVGYFSTLQDTPDLVIARETLSGKVDYAMTISCLAVILVVLVSSPANYFPFKNTLNYMITGNLEVSTKM
jgi:amino acid permease